MLGLLRGGGGRMELFRYSAGDLHELYGDAWAADALFVLRKVEAFARLCGEDTAAALASYGEWIERALAERASQPAPGSPQDDPRFGIHYLYALTLSTALNRSRYELLCDYRQAVVRHLPAGTRSLEIGAGNCMAAALAGGTRAGERLQMNELSRLWPGVLELGGSVDLRIEPYRFDEPGAFGFVTMIELLEHVADPAAYLAGAGRVLADGGLAYLTFAVRMPQFDHLVDFATVEECRQLVADHGFTVRDERCLIDTYQPFAEADRWRLAADPRHAVIYCCLAQKDPRPEPSLALRAFNLEID